VSRHCLFFLLFNKSIKQSHLASGIYSPSYLSKIESNETHPSDEILERLFQKLGLTVADAEQISQSSMEEQLLPELLSIYIEVTEKRNPAYVKEKLDYLFEKRLLYTDKAVFYMYNLVMLRLLLSSDVHLKRVNFYLQPLFEDRDSLNKYQSFLLKKLEGVYAFYLKKHAQAKSHFDEAHKLSYRLQDDWEIADFHYMYGIIHMVNHQHVGSIEYRQKAFNYYVENFQFDRAVQCYIHQGIIGYRQSKKYEEARQIYAKVEIIIKKFELHQYEGIFLQNLGCLYVSLRDYEKAITYYKKSLERKTERESKLLTIFSIVNSYSRLQDEANALEWTEGGLELVKDQAQPTAYTYHLLFYKELRSKEASLHVKKLTNIVHYFSKVEDYRNAYKYSMKIGDMLINRKKYKDASFFYKMAMEYNHKYRGIESWEDI
jgi:HTH-type transcriptional regulator, quorum sensing regulator NprR